MKTCWATPTKTSLTVHQGKLSLKVAKRLGNRLLDHLLPPPLPQSVSLQAGISLALTMVLLQLVLAMISVNQISSINQGLKQVCKLYEFRNLINSSSG